MAGSNGRRARACSLEPNEPSTCPSWWRSPIKIASLTEIRPSQYNFQSDSNTKPWYHNNYLLSSSNVCPLNVKLEMNFRSPKNASILNLMLPNDFHIGSLCFSLARQTSESTWTSKGSEWLFLPVLNGQQTVEVNVTAGVDEKNLSLRSSETLPLTSAFDLLTAILESNGKNDIQCVPV